MWVPCQELRAWNEASHIPHSKTSCSTSSIPVQNLSLYHSLSISQKGLETEQKQMNQQLGMFRWDLHCLAVQAQWTSSESLCIWLSPSNRSGPMLWPPSTCPTQDKGIFWLAAIVNDLNDQHTGQKVEIVIARCVATWPGFFIWQSVCFYSWVLSCRTNNVYHIHTLCILEKLWQGVEASSFLCILLQIARHD